MKLTDTHSISPHVVATHVGDETVILHLECGTYFGLDPVGARIWQLIGEGKALGAICEVMLNEYDVSREELERDTMNLVEDLLARNLINPPSSEQDNSGRTESSNR